MNGLWASSGLRTSCSHVKWLCLSDCMRSSGVGYRGAQQSSSSGLTCLNWTNTTRDYDVNVHPDSQTGKQHALMCLLTQRPVNILFHGGRCCECLPVVFWSMLVIATLSLQDLKKTPLASLLRSWCTTVPLICVFYGFKRLRAGISSLCVHSGLFNSRGVSWC